MIDFPLISLNYRPISNIGSLNSIRILNCLGLCPSFSCKDYKYIRVVVPTARTARKTLEGSQTFRKRVDYRKGFALKRGVAKWRRAMIWHSVFPALDLDMGRNFGIFRDRGEEMENFEREEQFLGGRNQNFLDQARGTYNSDSKITLKVMLIQN